MKIIHLLIFIQAVWGFNPPSTCSSRFKKVSLSLSGQCTRELPLTYHSSILKPKRNFSLSLESGNDHGGDQALTKKIEGRKKRVIAGYRITSILYLLLAIIIAIKSRILYYSGGPLLISGFSYILTDSATNNRLSSDTYKRLNLALGTGILVSSIGSFLMRSVSIELLFAFVGFVNAIKGYGYGLRTWELNDACAKEDIAKGIKDSIFSMLKIKNVNSALYSLSTLTIGTMVVLKMTEVAQLIFSNSKGFQIGTRLYRLAKLILMSVVTFTLKDAADRDRLKGTTFIELNYLISFIFLTLSGKCLVYIYFIDNSFMITLVILIFNWIVFLRDCC